MYTINLIKMNWSEVHSGRNFLSFLGELAKYGMTLGYRGFPRVEKAKINDVSYNKESQKTIAERSVEQANTGGKWLPVVVGGSAVLGFIGGYGIGYVIPWLQPMAPVIVGTTCAVGTGTIVAYKKGLFERKAKVIEFPVLKLDTNTDDSSQKSENEVKNKEKEETKKASSDSNDTRNSVAAKRLIFEGNSSSSSSTNQLNSGNSTSSQQTPKVKNGQALNTSSQQRPETTKKDVSTTENKSFVKHSRTPTISSINNETEAEKTNEKDENIVKLSSNQNNSDSFAAKRKFIEQKLVFGQGKSNEGINTQQKQEKPRFQAQTTEKASSSLVFPQLKITSEIKKDAGQDPGTFSEGLNTNHQSTGHSNPQVEFPQLHLFPETRKSIENLTQPQLIEPEIVNTTTPSLTGGSSELSLSQENELIDLQEPLDYLKETVEYSENTFNVYKSGTVSYDIPPDGLPPIYDERTTQEVIASYITKTETTQNDETELNVYFEFPCGGAQVKEIDNQFKLHKSEISDESRKEWILFISALMFKSIPLDTMTKTLGGQKDETPKELFQALQALAKTIYPDYKILKQVEPKKEKIQKDKKSRTEKLGDALSKTFSRGTTKSDKTDKK